MEISIGLSLKEGNCEFTLMNITRGFEFCTERVNIKSPCVGFNGNIT